MKEPYPMPALTPDAVRGHVADVLGEPVDEIGDHDNLLERGVDSIRLMSLVERWRELGFETSFIDLAQTPTIAGWSELLSKEVAS